MSLKNPETQYYIIPGSGVLYGVKESFVLPDQTGSITVVYPGDFFRIDILENSHHQAKYYKVFPLNKPCPKNGLGYWIISGPTFKKFTEVKKSSNNRFP